MKWQQTRGTAEHKVPFEVMCLADAVGAALPAPISCSAAMVAGRCGTIADTMRAAEAKIPANQPAACSAASRSPVSVTVPARHASRSASVGSVCGLPAKSCYFRTVEVLWVAGYRHAGCWQPQRSSVRWPAALQCSLQYSPVGTTLLDHALAAWMSALIRLGHDRTSSQIESMPFVVEIR